jgi:hypothetical protein
MNEFTGKPKLGYTNMGRFSWAKLELDLAEIQHEEWRKRYGKTNPKCNIPFYDLPNEEIQKNRYSIKAIILALELADYLRVET